MPAKMAMHPAHVTFTSRAEGQWSKKIWAHTLFASDAEHEFPRIRSAGLSPTTLFRRSGCPQLLLMQPTLSCRRVLGNRQTSKQGVFMIRKTRYRGVSNKCFVISIPMLSNRERNLSPRLDFSVSPCGGSFEMTIEDCRTTSRKWRGDPCSGFLREVIDRADRRASG
jgi:hypothetical protein